MAQVAAESAVQEARGVPERLDRAPQELAEPAAVGPSREAPALGRPESDGALAAGRNEAQGKAQAGHRAPSARAAGQAARTTLAVSLDGVDGTKISWEF